MKHLIIFILFFTVSLQAQAQKNRFELGVGRYKCFNVMSQADGKIHMYNIRYTRFIATKVGAFFNYERAPLNFRALAVIHPLAAIASIGKLTMHNQFNYFDLGSNYNFFTYRKHHFSGFAALSAAYGENTYLINAVWSEPEPGEPYGHPFHTEMETRKESYFGALAGIRYDYIFWKNRINIGPSFSARYYLNDFPFQINYRLHLGFNF